MLVALLLTDVCQLLLDHKSLLHFTDLRSLDFFILAIITFLRAVLADYLIHYYLLQRLLLLLMLVRYYLIRHPPSLRNLRPRLAVLLSTSGPLLLRLYAMIIGPCRLTILCRLLL